MKFKTIFKCVKTKEKEIKTIKTKWIFIALIMMVFPGRSISHEIVELVVPAIADPRDNAILSCRFDMGNDHLYSAKWFKDDLEIFRHMPGQKPAGLPFPVGGIRLARDPRCSSTSCDLELTDLVAHSAGVYRCEVSTEGPTFRMVQKNANMTVAALPLRDPLVEGAATIYSLGDEIRANCTSDPSLPPAEVTWYINDNEATFPNLEGASQSPPDSRGLTTKSLGLRLTAERRLFQEIGTGSSRGLFVRLRCVSVMPPWLPGGPHRRQFTITAALRPSSPLNNQKLEWPGSDAVTRTTIYPALLLLTSAALTFLGSPERYVPQLML